MADIKFSQFTPGGTQLATDTVVGLRGGINTKFTASPQIVTSWNGSTTPLAITPGANINIDAGVISASNPGPVIMWNGSTNPVNITAGTNISIAGGVISTSATGVILTWNGATTPVDVTAGAGIDITGGTITATGAPTTYVAYGEMYFPSENSRATSVPYPTFGWVKIEAGDFTAPASPPLYTGYTAGNLNNFAFANGRLTYIGNQGLYFKVTCVTSATFGSGARPTSVAMDLFKNGGPFTDSSSNKQVISPSVINSPDTIAANGNGFCAQRTVFLVYGDYIEAWIENITNAQGPIFEHLNLIISPLSAAGTTNNFAWTTVTANTQMNASTGYYTNSGSMLLMNLPPILTEGDTVTVSGLGAGGWQITQNAGQSIIFGSQTTAVGTTGYLQSGTGSPSDEVTLIAVDSTRLKVFSPMGANIIVKT